MIRVLIVDDEWMVRAMLRTIMETAPDMTVVGEASDGNEAVEQAAAHAPDVVLKDATAPEMLAAVRSAAHGDAMLSPKITRRLLRDFAGTGRSEARGRLDVLTAKEREVLVAVGGGLSNPEVAAALHMSEATAKTHVSRILAKLALGNRVQAAILAHRAGLLDP
ncbi:response regulator transcription factor [Actinomadura terrae]|uniref:response regulator transcription factor n=1 Tax=Actinomadura terrae TaxID=604353 RepID=UPI001FA7C09C|nr:response regulator transcription factor [Actinomadura terrae]